MSGTSATERIEIGTDPTRKQRMQMAAELSGMSLRAFVAQAAYDKTDELLARYESTLVPQDFFDELLATLDVSDKPNEAMKRYARRAVKKS